MELPVAYLGFDGFEHVGSVVVHRALIEDVAGLFEEMRRRRFPLAAVVPAGDPRFGWDDARLMAANVTSAFNYRTIAGSERLSWHAYGRAIDINPALNPYVRGGRVEPPGATYDPARPGTIGPDSFIVEFLERRGWSWGGRWTEPIDYQHFQKP